MGLGAAGWPWGPDWRDPLLPTLCYAIRTAGGTWTLWKLSSLGGKLQIMLLLLWPGLLCFLLSAEDNSLGGSQTLMFWEVPQHRRSTCFGGG